MATTFSFSDPNPGVWFKFDERDPDSGEICIRSVNMAKRNEINKKANKKRIEYKHGQRFEVVESDDDMFSELLWDYVISDWKNLTDDAGKLIECTKSNKLFLMQNNVLFSSFVGSCMEKMNLEIETRAKEVEKN